MAAPTFAGEIVTGVRDSQGIFLTPGGAAESWVSDTRAWSLSSDGSAEFAGAIISGADPTSGASTGFQGNSSGVMRAARSSGNLFEGYTVGNSTATSQIKADGNAEFAGTVTADSFQTSSGAPVGGSPTGSVTMFAGVTVPTGWLECNGQAAPSALAAVLGQANVPDLRGEFVRGHDNGRGVDAGRALLSSQSGEIQSHDHSINDPSHSHPLELGNPEEDYGDNFPGASDNRIRTKNGPSATTGISINAAGGAETRPRNVALMYIIKT
jgi:microcystin-dependent protein